MISGEFDRNQRQLYIFYSSGASKAMCTIKIDAVGGFNYQYTLEVNRQIKSFQIDKQIDRYVIAEGELNYQYNLEAIYTGFFAWRSIRHTSV